MRALLEAPDGCDERRYRRFVRRAQVDGLLADHLVLGEPYLALNALVLTRPEARTLADLTEVFGRAFERAGRALAADVPGLVELGFPWAAAELLAAERPRRPLVGRFDFVQDRSGHWWVLEFNADTPSGVREAIAVDRLAFGLLPTAGLVRPNEGLAERLVAAVLDALAGAPPGATLGLVTTVSELEDLAQMAFTADLLRAPLAARGLAVVLGDADNLRASARGLSLLGRRVAALYRYVPLEAAFGTPAFVAIFEAATAGRLELLNGLFGLLLQHKRLLAWLWEHRDDPAVPADERAAIAAHLPPTWAIDRYPPEVTRQELVAKQVFGREGEEVYFGEDLAADDWAKLVRGRTYVAQRRIEVAELAAAVPTALGPTRRVGRPTVGSYAVDGRAAGFYTRFGDKITTSRAKFLATFTEIGGRTR